MKHEPKKEGLGMVGTKTLLCGVWCCGLWLFAGLAHADPPDADDDVDADAAPDDPTVAPPGLAAPAQQPPFAQPPPRAAPRPLPSMFQEAPTASDDAADDELAGDRPGRRRSPQRFTVTGSLIERATLTTPQPVTFLRRPELLGAGRTMVGDVLQTLPEQGNAINAQFNNGGDGSTRINLRSLDTTRTLTLVNGRRFVPVGTGADTTVDLNTIPLVMIDRVEVLKDGASPVYGSDAIGGVVNIITRGDFRGTEASLYTGQSSRRDGFTFDASLITGHRLADGRGNIVFAAETQRQEPIFAGDRDFSRVFNVFDFNSGTVTPSGSSSTPNGRIDTRRIDLNGDGVPDTVNLCGMNVRFCTNDGHGGFRPFIAPGDLYNFQPVNYLYTPSSRTSAYTVGSFRLQPQMEGFFEASFMHRASQQQLAPEPLISDLFGIKISRFSIYNPIGGDVLSYNRRLEEFGPRRFNQSIDTLRTVIGMRSTPDANASPDAWKWELSFNYGRNTATGDQQGHLVLSKLRNAVGPSFISPVTGPTCGTPAAPIAGCVPMNLLGPSGSISEAARNYAAFTAIDTGSTLQQMALATAQGKIVRLPGGGDVTLAVTADVRKETGEFTPDAFVASGDTTGLQQPSVSGSTTASEIAAEVSIVPVRDRDGVERLEADFAARAFHYDTFGDGTVASARALARPVRGITLRASWANSFRAPSVTELFQASVDDFPFIPDPCDHAFGTPPPNVAAECAREGVPANAVFGTQQQHAISHGNLKLQPETAKTMSAGIVLEMPRAPGISLSVDWWNINVTQTIQPLLLQNLFVNCYQRGLRDFCALVHRDPARGFAINFVDTPFFNTGGKSTKGMDAAINVNHHAPGVGDLHARLDLQEMDLFDVDTGTGRTLNGLAVYDFGVLPKRKWTASAQWRHPQGLSAGFNFEFIDKFIECQNDDCNNEPANPSRTVDSYSKLDVFSSITLGGRRTAETTLTIGVNNVFDRAPPVIYNGAAANFDTATYDVAGRFMYARLTQAF